MSNAAFVVVAYAITWVVFLGYLRALSRRARRAEEGLASLPATAGDQP